MNEQIDTKQGKHPELKVNAQDGLALALKGVAGAIPVAGGIVAEIIGELIPNQRVDRIVAFLMRLDQRVSGIEAETLRTKMQDPESVDLFEDACFQASRALTDERLEYLASAFANSLTHEELDHLYKKKLMWLLGELNDTEIIILTHYSIPQYHGSPSEFYLKHREVIDMPAVTNDASDDEVKEANFKHSFRQRLAQLGLLRPNFRKPKRNEFPEFDYKTGQVKSSGYEITQLGRLFVEFIGTRIEAHQNAIG